jgi:hypothetical protein
LFDETVRDLREATPNTRLEQTNGAVVRMEAAFAA